MSFALAESVTRGTELSLALLSPQVFLKEYIFEMDLKKNLGFSNRISKRKSWGTGGHFTQGLTVGMPLEFLQETESIWRPHPKKSSC